MEYEGLIAGYTGVIVASVRRRDEELNFGRRPKRSSHCCLTTQQKIYLIMVVYSLRVTLKPWSESCLVTELVTVSVIEAVVAKLWAILRGLRYFLLVLMNRKSLTDCTRSSWEL